VRETQRRYADYESNKAGDRGVHRSMCWDPRLPRNRVPLGRRSSQKNAAQAHEGIGVIEAAVFALLGLLLGFSFSGGTSRLETKRQLVVQEANAIGTAYLRLDELPVNEQPEMRRLFREYLDARLSVYEKLLDLKAVEQELAHAAGLQQ
jgi:hypothetical protein